MSRKNHKMIDGRLLQTDKKYSQLKMKQKEKIAEWMFQSTRDYYMKQCTFPNDKHLEEVVDSVYEKIEDAEIWIPYGEVFKHYKSKRSDINKRVRKSLNEKEESRIEKVCFMNMCMIQDDEGKVLALDKVKDSYTGTTFPGGHVEANEIFQKSMIREVWEETGLTIEAPKFGGLYHSLQRLSGKTDVSMRLIRFQNRSVVPVEKLAEPDTVIPVRWAGKSVI